ncbi:LytR cell envelope-related transcriptional attenuator [Amycolatopsis arida]|uniref:LytR cell envelope-related transcriptional attenuator n=1 Tax=Amycolatopsis arida TaxID=587909 RepID=A0A1I5QT35_9PSEU|nr:LytR C-terminal domain-containing protein [Amycolatopsis arida]TDX98947.1 LytR cell envelope-related transcriptional attenuator [Amycolatopsis arida]SFP49201.1 LytR cell envelope-related transcriptional attenuator [Amycolatopsis arida]
MSTSSGFAGLSRPARAAGIGLLAVAAAAAVIGGVTLLTGNGDGEDTAAPPPPATTAPPSPTEPPGTTPPEPEPTSPTDTTPPETSPGDQPGEPGTPPAPGQPGGPPGDGAPSDQQASAKWVAVRVYNNSTTKGLATQAAQDLRSQGWNVSEVGNYSSGIIPTTTVYYRPGTDEETAARAIGAEFGMRVEPRFEGIADSSPGVIVIITNDYGSTPKGKTGK